MTRFEKISNWVKMKRVMTLVSKFKIKLKQKLNGSQNMETEPSVVSLMNISEVDLPERQLLKLVQNQAFCKEIEVLKKKENIPRTR